MYFTILRNLLFKLFNIKPFLLIFISFFFSLPYILVFERVIVGLLNKAYLTKTLEIILREIKHTNSFDKLIFTEILLMHLNRCTTMYTLRTTLR